MEHLVKLVENKPLNLLGCKNLLTYFLKVLASHIPPRLQKRGSQPIRVYGEQSVLSYIAYSSHSSKVWFGLMMVRHLPLICHGLFSNINPSKKEDMRLSSFSCQSHELSRSYYLSVFQFAMLTSSSKTNVDTKIVIISESEMTVN